MTVLQKVSEVDWLMDLDNGNQMYVVVGADHSDEDLIETVREFEDDDPGGEWLEITEGKWGWSPRFKWCSNHDTGWGCDNEGEWHRHYSLGYGSERSTAIAIRHRKPLGPIFGRLVAVPESTDSGPRNGD